MTNVGYPLTDLLRSPWRRAPLGRITAVEYGRRWQELAQWIIRERTRLGFRSRAAFARRSGISTATLDNLENARKASYDPTTIARLERALQWEDGSVSDVLAGRKPRQLRDEDLTVLLDAWQFLSPGSRRMLRTLAEQAARSERSLN